MGLERRGRQGRHCTGTGKRSERGQRSGGQQTPEGCPSGLSAAQCSAVADAITAGGRKTPDDACPAGLSKTDCESVAAALDSGSGRSAAKEQESCPAGLTRSQCKQLAAALGG